jgi:SAM-dependent methyltransferase
MQPVWEVHEQAMTRPTVWDRIFGQHGKVFEGVHEDLPRLLRWLRTLGGRTVLDLGCGSGRHVAYVAQHGLSVYGLDSSAEGLLLTRQTLARLGLTADLRLGDIFEPLPYADGLFDALIAVQVIHHAPLAPIRRLAAEIARVVGPGGLLFVSVPQLRNQGTRFEQIEPGTYVPLDGREAGLPHHYFTPDELRAAFDQFEVADLHLDRDSHYCLTAIRAGAGSAHL